MHYFALLATFLVAGLQTSASPIEAASSRLYQRQSATSVVTAISTLGRDAQALNDTLNTFKPNDVLSVVTAYKIQSQTSTLENDLTSSIDAANASPAFTDDESYQVAAAVLAFEPMIQSLLNNIVQKKPAFATAVLLVGDLSQTVESSLERQRSLSGDFSTAVRNKLTPNYAAFAPLIAAQIQGYFDTAIAAYQSCTGLVCLPPLELE